MKVSPVEVVDRFTIVKLKSERIGGDEIKKELASYARAIENFRESGIEIKQEWVEKLYEINGNQWDLENEMKKAKESGPDLKKMGQVYIEIQKSNKRRVSVKNEIAESTELGFKDIDIN